MHAFYIQPSRKQGTRREREREREREGWRVKYRNLRVDDFGA